ncbi:MAG: AAA family ATPase [Candidatus Omnitrophota bacterium]
MKTKDLPIGISDFKDMVTGNYYYVDKTLFIKEVIDSGDKILVLPRPRRFGKTLNISMLGYFYDCCKFSWGAEHERNTSEPSKEPDPSENYKHLFDSLAILKAGPKYLDKMGQYPVVFLSFRLIKEKKWELCLNKIKRLIQKEYLRHDYLMNSPVIKPQEKMYFQKIIELTGDLIDYENSLENLLIFLSRYYNRRAVILIDEYDAPVHAGFTGEYYEDIINFMRNFLSGGLKDTDPYLEKGVVTGIMRIAKESIFSGFNNAGVYTLLQEDFNNHFGFTEEEVKTMLDDFQVSHLFDQVQLWYNGYRFGGKVIYNPWSIINFLRSKKKELVPYWINTSDNEIVESLLSRKKTGLREELEQLIRGETIEKAIEDNIVLKDIYNDEDALWSFLLMGGYLKQISKRRDNASGRMVYSLSVPNEEVKTTYTRIIRRYFSTKIENKKSEVMLNALIDGDIPLFEQMLREIVSKIFSYHDFSGEPEKVYHALVMGLLIWITNTHEVKSNRESGYGRYDIMIIPRDLSRIGYVIEFKTVNSYTNETVETALESALAQIEKKKYEMELVERGVRTIKKLGIAFSGKEVFVKSSD